MAASGDLTISPVRRCPPGFENVVVAAPALPAVRIVAHTVGYPVLNLTSSGLTSTVDVDTDANGLVVDKSLKSAPVLQHPSPQKRFPLDPQAVEFIAAAPNLEINEQNHSDDKGKLKPNTIPSVAGNPAKSAWPNIPVTPEGPENPQGARGNNVSISMNETIGRQSNEDEETDHTGRTMTGYHSEVHTEDEYSDEDEPSEQFIEDLSPVMELPRDPRLWPEYNFLKPTNKLMWRTTQGSKVNHRQYVRNINILNHIHAALVTSTYPTWEQKLLKVEIENLYGMMDPYFVKVNLTERERKKQSGSSEATGSVYTGSLDIRGMDLMDPTIVRPQAVGKYTMKNAGLMRGVWKGQGMAVNLMMEKTEWEQEWELAGRSLPDEYMGRGRLYETDTRWPQPTSAPRVVLDGTLNDNEELKDWIVKNQDNLLRRRIGAMWQPGTAIPPQLSKNGQRALRGRLEMPTPIYSALIPQNERGPYINVINVRRNQDETDQNGRKVDTTQNSGRGNPMFRGRGTAKVHPAKMKLWIKSAEEGVVMEDHGWETVSEDLDDSDADSEDSDSSDEEDAVDVELDDDDSNSDSGSDMEDESDEESENDEEVGGVNVENSGRGLANDTGDKRAPAHFNDRAFQNEFNRLKVTSVIPTLLDCDAPEGVDLSQWPAFI